MPRTLSKLDKAPSTRILPIGKPRSYIEMVRKAAMFAPGPDKYNVIKKRGYIGSLMTNPIVAKRDRETEAAELMRFKRKMNVPSPSQYKLNYGQLEKNVASFIEQKVDRIGYLDEAAWRS